MDFGNMVHCRLGGVAHEVSKKLKNSNKASMLLQVAAIST